MQCLQMTSSRLVESALQLNLRTGLGFPKRYGYDSKSELRDERSRR